MQNCIISGGENIGLCFEQPAIDNYHGNNNLFPNNNNNRLIYVGGVEEFSLEEYENGDWTAFSGEDSNSVSAATLNDIYQNPLETDFHLYASSPAIDLANPAYAPDIDFDGNIRPFGPAPDMGAYESQQELPAYEVSPKLLTLGPYSPATVHHRLALTAVILTFFLIRTAQ